MFQGAAALNLDVKGRLGVPTRFRDDLMAACGGQVVITCLLYPSDAADERSSVNLGGRRIIKKKKNSKQTMHLSDDMNKNKSIEHKTTHTKNNTYKV